MAVLGLGRVASHGRSKIPRSNRLNNSAFFGRWLLRFREFDLSLPRALSDWRWMSRWESTEELHFCWVQCIAIVRQWGQRQGIFYVGCLLFWKSDREEALEILSRKECMLCALSAEVEANSWLERYVIDSCRLALTVLSNALEQVSEHWHVWSIVLFHVCVGD